MTFFLLQLHFAIDLSNLVSENYVTELSDVHMHVKNNLSASASISFGSAS